jgi:hypothetical protein
VPATPGHGRIARRVTGRDEQAAEHAQVLEEVDLLVGPFLLVVALPESVTGGGGG